MKNSSVYALVTLVFLGSFVAFAPEANAATLKSNVLASASSQKGAKYAYGKEGGYSKGYDCSGLIKWSFKQNGKTVPRTAQGQRNHFAKINPKNRKSGDLIFIHDRYGNVYHVGIFTGVRNGKGYMLNANSGRTTAHKVGEWPVTNYTAGSPFATYG